MTSVVKAIKVQIYRNRVQWLTLVPESWKLEDPSMQIILSDTFILGVNFLLV
jgi:hypothetical protein